MRGSSWDFIGEVLIIGWIFKIFPRLSFLFISGCLIMIIYYMGLDTQHVGGSTFVYEKPTGVEGGWDGMQYWYWDKRDKKWIPESELYNIKTSENRIDFNLKKRSWQLSDDIKNRYKEEDIEEVKKRWWKGARKRARQKGLLNDPNDF